MKRLLGLLGLTCLGVLTACFYLGENVGFMLAAGALLLFLVSMAIPDIRKAKTLPVGFLSVVLTVSLFMGYTHLRVEPIKAYDGQTCTVEALQTDNVYYSYGYYHYVLDIKEINGEKVNSGMILHTKRHIFSDAFDELRFTAELSFTENDSYKSRKLFLESYVFDENTVDVKPADKRPLRYQFINIKNKVSTALFCEMDYDSAAFSSSVLLSDKYAMKPDVKSLLNASGLSHIVVVSGLHLSIIAMMTGKMLSKIIRNKVISGTFTLLVIWCFAAVCGFTPSVMRAGIMLTIFIIGTMIYRKSDAVNSLGAAALFIILPNPYSAGDVGLLLSFVSTLGIVLWCSKISAPAKKTLYKCKLFRLPLVRKGTAVIIDTFSMCLCASLWSLPIIVFINQQISAVSLIANILVVPFMLPVLLIIFLCILTHYIGFLQVICNLCAHIISCFYSYLIFVCRSLTALPYASIYTNTWYFYFWISATLVICGIAVIVSRKAFNVLTVFLSLLILFAGAFVYRVEKERKLILHIPYTGQGMTVLLESSSGYAVLKADGNPRRSNAFIRIIESIPYRDSNVYIDVPGNNNEIYAESVLNEFDYEIVLRYDNKSEDSTYDYITWENTQLFESDCVLDLWDKASVRFLVCNGVVCEYITAGDTDILILARGADCINIPEEYRNLDVIVADRVPDNYLTLSCDTLIVQGNGYISDVTAYKMSEISKRIIENQEIYFEIEIE